MQGTLMAEIGPRHLSRNLTPVFFFYIEEEFRKNRKTSKISVVPRHFYYKRRLCSLTFRGRGAH